MNSEKVETWHGIIISPTYHVQKSREGYGKNWMHFVYKLDNLFRSIRDSDENSSVTKALHFLELITTPEFLCVQYAPFKAGLSTTTPTSARVTLFLCSISPTLVYNFVHSLCTIQSHVINFQPFLPLFSIFHAFTDLFSDK